MTTLNQRGPVGDLPPRTPGPRSRILVCFCCQGGEAKGYADAGFDVVGVDTVPQPRFPFEFYQDDAIKFVKEHGHLFDAVAGGPPCQRYSKSQRIQGNEHPDLIGPFREACQATGLPYVIENVEEARPELINPELLFGTMFGLHTDRHRLFETNWSLTVPEHIGGTHKGLHTKMGRPWRPGTLYQAVGNFSGVDFVRKDMGVPWMNRDGIRECIPPVYSEWIGNQLREQL